MRRTTLGVVAAIITAGCLVLGAGPAQAASARPDPPQIAITPGEVQAIVSAAATAYSAYKTFLNGDLSVQQATTQILNAIYSAKAEIIARIDAVAAAQARACAQDAVLDFENFDVLTPDNRQAFALAATSCVNFIDSQLVSSPDKAAADQLGFALQAVGPIALIVRSRVNLPNNNFVPILVRSTQRVITLLTPTCTSRTLEGRTQWTCRVYGDHVAGPEPSRSLAEKTAAARTSRPVAKAVLPILQSS
jgi:hypothetical protein